ncbi:hypothetical protein PCANC_04624 [Puccinia coronata f. sp. avenae]|uniref:Uncharacterized protein n=1 Tax=Puccinia coronata f. sp. avenae TaxID=200324 RepID=A0A2N5W0A5_9BASI|nr:hypothetical protein PCANC_04624 [Puccinia coronata f. sp. avenae]
MLLAAHRLEATGAEAQKPTGARRAAHGGPCRLSALMGRADFKKFTKIGVRARPKAGLGGLLDTRPNYHPE